MGRWCPRSFASSISRCVLIAASASIAASIASVLLLRDPSALLSSLLQGPDRSPWTRVEYSPSCDYTVGRWVKTDAKPLYSGKACKRWLSGPWSCRLSPEHKSFEYERYRWQPSDCDLPRFHSQRFLERMSGKVIAFVGDSIGRQQYQSLMCMLTGGRDEMAVEDVGLRYGLLVAPTRGRPGGVANRFVSTNTTVIYYWAVLLCDIRPASSNASDHRQQQQQQAPNAVHLDRPPTFLEQHLGAIDVLVLNSAHHWNKGKVEANRWAFYMAGRPLPDYLPGLYAMDDLRRLALSSIARWLHEQIVLNRTRAEVYFRSLSPRHFSGGDWDSGGRCDNNVFSPLETQKNLSSSSSSSSASVDSAAAAASATPVLLLDRIAEGTVRGTRIRLLNITRISAFRDDAHIAKYKKKDQHQDCLHWCLPGIPDVWNEILYARLLVDSP